MNDKSPTESRRLVFLSQVRISAAARVRSNPCLNFFPPCKGTDRCARCWLSSPLCLPSSSVGRRWSITRWTPTLWGSLCSISSLKRSRTCALMCKWEHLLPLPPQPLSHSPLHFGPIQWFGPLTHSVTHTHKPPVKTQEKTEKLYRKEKLLKTFFYICIIYSYIFY